LRHHVTEFLYWLILVWFGTKA